MDQILDAYEPPANQFHLGAVVGISRPLQGQQSLFDDLGQGRMDIQHVTVHLIYRQPQGHGLDQRLYGVAAWGPMVSAENRALAGSARTLAKPVVSSRAHPYAVSA